MVVLVAYATRHGATAGIAERIAADLSHAGIPAEAQPVHAVRDVRAFDAVVLGGAAYLSHWHQDATDFARTYRVALRERPVWLFSSGPLGADLLDKDRADLLHTCQPKEFWELSALVRARGVQVFFGAYDPEAPPATVGERMLALLPTGKAALPAGDFRDWPAIDAWAAQIAAALNCEQTGLRSSQGKLATRHGPRLDA
ncbi:MAG: flavodoxin domain-containing protein [Ornithinibacter sp.]